MTRIENLLRAATREAAAEVTQDSIPPLDTATLPVLRRPVLRRSVLRFDGPLTPLLAAVAVVLTVTLSLVLSTVVAAPRPPSGVTLPGVPPYYVALTATGSPAGNLPVKLTVRSTFTGKVLATVTAPRPYGTFNLIDGTADDRTFLVGAQVWHPQIIGRNFIGNIFQPVRLFWLRYDPSSGTARLTALPLPQFNGEWLVMASVSLDGTRVAIGYQDTHKLSFRVYTLPGGAEHTLSLKPAQEAAASIAFHRNNPATIAWAADDRTISFMWSGRTEYGVHVLDTAAAGSDGLLSASRFVLPLTGGIAGSSDFRCDSDPFLSANGAYILCGGYTVPKKLSPLEFFWPKGPVTQGFGEFSATTGKLIAILGARRGPLPTVRFKDPVFSSQGSGPKTQITVNTNALPYLLWASPDAKVLIGTVNGKGIIVRDGREQAIPWSSAIAVPEGSFLPGAAW